MKRAGLFVIILALGLFAAGASAGDEEGQTLTGAFVWNNQDRTGDLKAVFTEGENGKWNVAFHFTWEGEPRVFAGTAVGNLSEGELKGEVLTDGERQRTFKFAGSFEDGTFHGTHHTVGNDGNERETGTLTLQP